MNFFLSTFVLSAIITIQKTDSNYLLYNTEYYIESSNLWIGINIGFRNVNLTLNLKQDETPNGNKIIREPVSWYVKITSLGVNLADKKYLSYMEHYIEGSNLWIGIKMELKNENFTLNIDSNLLIGIRLGVGSLALNLKQDRKPNENKTFQESVSGFIKITSGRSAKPYLLQHNARNLIICRRYHEELSNCTCEEENGNIIRTTQDYLNNTDHYITTEKYVIGIRVGNKKLTLIIEFNKARPLPDIAQEDLASPELPSQTATTHLGFSSRDYVSEMIEKQADAIRALKNHNYILARKIYELQQNTSIS
ncbi:unnamed protein product [Gordionus sp. m RMFG-2023]